MKDQIDVREMREITDAIKPVIPLMNHTEMTQLALFAYGVINRYKREEYPDYDWDDDDAND